VLIKLADIKTEAGQQDTTNEWQPGNFRLDSLTSLRFFAAVIVALHHAKSNWVYNRFTDLMGQFGWLGVTFFFILSGFVLMWGYDPAISYRNFVFRRLARIYPLHFLTLVFTLLFFLRFGSSLAGNVGNFWGTVASFLLIHDWLPLAPMVRQAWNGVSWTLSCEFFFYLCAPLLFASLTAMPSRRYWLFPVLWAAWFGIAVLATMQHWGRVLDILEYFPLSRFLEFVLGAAAALQLKRRSFCVSKTAALAALAMPLAFYCVLVPVSSDLRSGPVMISLVIPGALLLIVAAALADIQGYRSVLRIPVLVFLGEASFALYMTHAMLLSLMRYFASKIFPHVGSILVQAECFRVFYIVCAILLSCVVYYYIEHPLRFRLLRKIRAR